MDVDKQGNVWVVDARVADGRRAEEISRLAGKGNTVTKFSPDGKVLLVLGTPGKTGNPPEAFTEPNDVVIAPDGSIYRRPSRTARSSSTNRRRTRSAASRSSRLTASSSRASAATATDRPVPRTALAGLRFAGPPVRRRSRQPPLQIFDQDGKHLDTWYQFSRISGIHIDADDTLYAIDSESDDNYNPGWRKGLRVGSAKTGEVWFFVPEHVSKQASGMGGFGSMGEGVTADAQGNVYAGEVGPIQGMTKFIPRLKR